MRGSRAPLHLAAALLCATLAGCATTGPDPWEGANRAVFSFNEGVDRFVLEPVAVGWDFVLPERAQWGVTNFFDNLGMPVVFLNDLLQGKPVAAAQDVGRFAVNTTVGIVGLVDVASRLDIPAHDEDFGQTLGRWGLPAGPYVVLPLLGPSSVRDTFGWAVDTVSRPEFWLVDTYILAGGTAVEVVNTRARLIEEIRESRETAFDYYTFVRNAYLANRERKVRDGKPTAAGESDDDLYMLDEELSEDGSGEEDEGAGASADEPADDGAPAEPERPAAP